MREEELKNKVDFYLDRCRSILEQDGLMIDYSSFDRNIIAKMILSSEKFEFASTGIETQAADDTNAIVLFCNLSGDIDKNQLKEQIHKKIEETEFSKIIVLARVESLSEKILFESAIKELKKSKTKSIDYSLIVDTSYDPNGATTFEIERFNVLIKPSLDTKFSAEKDDNKAQKNEIDGYVFTARLIDVINMYNEIGDLLFAQNVRYKIGDALGVDKAIEETLKENPEDFWYLNNGITITVREGYANFENPQLLCINHSCKEKKMKNNEIPFSVINGAQTISASAECYFSMKQEKAEVKAIEKNAYVLVKVFVIPDSQKNAAGKYAIALNRQKPIKIEDIAYTVPFVDEINTYANEHKCGFHISKRGENGEELNLAWFARINKACHIQPHEARNSSANKLLKCYPANGFADEDLHSSDFHDEEKREAVYNKYFAAVPSVYIFLKKYDKYIDDIRDGLEQEEKSILRNMRWHFVSYVLLCLGAPSDHKEIDYSKWDAGKLKKCFSDEKIMKKCMTRFAKTLKSDGITVEEYKNDSATVRIISMGKGDKKNQNETGLPKDIIQS